LTIFLSCTAKRISEEESLRSIEVESSTTRAGTPGNLGLSFRGGGIWQNIVVDGKLNLASLGRPPPASAGPSASIPGKIKV